MTAEGSSNPPPPPIQPSSQAPTSSSSQPSSPSSKANVNQGEPGPDPRTPPHPLNPRHTPFMTSASPFPSSHPSRTASTAQASFPALDANSQGDGTTAQQHEAIRGRLQTLNSDMAELLASNAVHAPASMQLKQEQQGSSIMPNCSLQQSVSLPTPQQQQQQQVMQATLAAEPLLEQQATEQKLYELQQLQLQLQQQQLLLQQRLLQQKHQESMQQWGVPLASHAQLQLNGGLLAAGLAQPLLQPPGSHPSQGTHALHPDNLLLLQTTHAPVLPGGPSGFAPSVATDNAAPLAGLGAGGGAGGRSSAVEEDPHKQPGSSASSSVSVETSTSMMKAEDLSALFSNASKEAMAMMWKAGGGAHAGGLPPVERTHAQRRRNQAAMRRMHPRAENIVKEHMVQPSRLSMTYLQEPAVTRAVDEEAALARVRHPTLSRPQFIPSVSKSDARFSTSEHPSLGTQDQGSNSLARQSSADSLPLSPTQLQLQQQQQPQQAGDGSVMGTSARPTVDGSDFVPPMPAAAASPPGALGPAGPVLASPQASLLHSQGLPLTDASLNNDPADRSYRGRRMSRTQPDFRTPSPQASMRSMWQASGAGMPVHAGELPPDDDGSERGGRRKGMAAAAGVGDRIGGAGVEERGNQGADGADPAADGPKALFADEDDDEAKKNDMLKAFTQKAAPWYKIAYWRWFMATIALAIVMFIIGLALQRVVEEEHEGNTESFRWLYFFALVPPLWYIIDICCHFLFKGIEWWLFRESLLYLKNVQRYTVAFILLLLLLLWHAVIFKWAWCNDDERCNAESYLEAVTILWNLQICFVLFALANLLKSMGAKFLSTHFYRTAHFKKLQAAIEKEHFLQVLSRPSTRVRAHRNESGRAHQEDSIESQAQGPAFVKGHINNLGSLWRHALGRTSTLQQPSAAADAAAESGAGGPNAHPAAATSASAAVTAAAPAAGGAEAATGGALPPQQPAQAGEAPPAFPLAPLASLKSAPSALISASLKAVASAIHSASNSNPNLLEGGIPDEGQQASLLRDALAQELASRDAAANPADTELHLSDSHVHHAHTTPAIPTAAAGGQPASQPHPQQQELELGRRAQSLQPPPPPPHLPPPPPASPPLPQPPPPAQDLDSSPAPPPQQQQQQQLGNRQPFVGGTAPDLHHPPEISIPAPPPGQPPRAGSMSTAASGMLYANALYNAPSMSSMQHAPSGIPTDGGTSAWMGQEGVGGRGGSLGGLSWFPGDGDDADFGTSLDASGLSTPAGADAPGVLPRAPPLRLKPGPSLPHPPSTRASSHAGGGGGGGDRGSVRSVGFAMPAALEPERDSGGSHQHTRGHNTLNRRGGLEGSKMPAISEPSDSESEDSEPGDVAVMRSMHSMRRMPSRSGPALMRLASTRRQGSLRGEPGTQAEGAAGATAPAANPLGPLGDVMMETVPLQSTDKKDLARMTDSELEKVRTAIVIKTYTAIIRNYSNMSAEEQDAELARVRAFSRALFYNIRGDEDRQYVSLEDFDAFFPDDPELARRAFRVFDVDNDNHVTRKEIKEGVLAIYRQRANMAASLKDTDSIVQSLEYALGCLIHFIFLAFYLLIWNVDIVKGFSTFSAMLLAFTFIFGNSVKNMFESMLFLFVEHPYDVGDTVLIKGELYRVKKISLLFTMFLHVNGEKIFFPNTDLMASIISNWTRSKTKTEYVRVQMDVGIPPDVLADIMTALVTHAAAHSTEFDGSPFVQYREVLESNLKLVMQISWTYAFPPDAWERLVPARNAMVGILQTKLKQHKIIQYTQNWKVQKSKQEEGG